MGKSKGNFFGMSFSIYFSLPEPWISYLGCCCVYRLLPIFSFLGSVTGPWQLLFIISWKDIFLKDNFFFFFFNTCRVLGQGRQDCCFTPCSVTSAGGHRRRARLWFVWAAQTRKAGLRASSQDRATQCSLLSPQITCNEGHTNAFLLRQITYPLCDKQRLVNCYREGRSCLVFVFSN